MPPPVDSTDASSPEGTSRPRPDQLHDLISIGEIESALSTTLSSQTESDGDTSLGIRLPLLLRWLTSVQPLVTTSPPLNLDGSTGTHSADSMAPLLEDVAAAHHNAENIEVLVSSLAPSVCREVVGKLPPISRKKSDNAFLSRQDLIHQDQDECDLWDTSVLDKALNRMTKQEQHKRKRGEKHAAVSDNKKQKLASNDEYLERMKTVIDVLEQDLDENNDEDMDLEQEANNSFNGGNAAFSSFADRGSNDSHIHMIRNVLHELILLVKCSLNSKEDRVVDSNKFEDGHRDPTQIQRGSIKSPSIPTKPDSILAQTDTLSSSFRLPALISALMHHAPILRHRHIASALCRASVPQTSTLIMHMAANCPAASSCLLRGCIDAYLAGRKYLSSAQSSSLGEEEDVDEKAVTIIQTSVESAEALASLSRREACNVVRVLRECGNHVMPSLAMKILLDIDETEAAAYIVEILSASPGSSTTALPNKLNQKRSMSVTKSHAIPLSQRMILRKPLLTRTEMKVNNLQLCTSPEELLEDQTITEAALSCMSKNILQLSRVIEESILICLGKASLHIQAYALLTHFLNAGRSTSKCASIFEETISAIHILSHLIQQNTTGSLKETTTDEFYTLCICATLFTTVWISDSKAACNTEKAENACLKCLQSLLLHPPSMNTTTFAARFANFVIENNSVHLIRYSLQSMSIGEFAVSDEHINKSEVCQWISSRFQSELLESVQGKVLTMEFVLYNASVFIEKMAQIDVGKSNELDIVRAILDDPEKCYQLGKQSNVIDFINEAAALTCRKKSPHIPLVMPLTLERLSRKLWTDVGERKEASSQFMQFVLQLLYALSFLDKDSASPFVINPRVFHLKETLDFMARLESSGGVEVLQKALKEHILHHCPDLIKAREKDTWLYQDVERVSSSFQNCYVPPMTVCDAIHDCIQSNTTDSSGVRAEKLFLASRSTYPNAMVATAVVETILASSSNNLHHPKIVSYISLCQDPLVLLQARAAFWKCKALRRILIRVLFDLMSANESITLKAAASQSAASQYLTARDTIIFRCVLLTCATSSVFNTNGKSCTYCDMCVSLMRSIASKRRGVIAALVKQGLPQSSIAFLVQFIPESFQDASEFMSLLGEKDAIPFVERLVTASTVLSVCVANSSRYEKTLKNLFTTSLDAFVDGFHLVIGPLGLPVSIFRDEDNGRDISLVCKEATFQMITTLSKIDARSALKNEAVAYLTKIANLCKSENAAGGVTGAKRKNLLKDIYDRCDSSMKSLGATLR